MKKVLLASTAVAAFVAFSGAAQAQDPGRADYGATEGGGGAGSAFTVTTKGAVKFYLKYASSSLPTPANDGFFTLVSGELEINGAATTDSGIDVGTHVDFAFAGTDSDDTQTIGGSDNSVAVGRIAIIDELSLKISGGFGSVELGSNDGAEDIFKIYGGTVAAGTGGIDGDHHGVSGGGLLGVGSGLKVYGSGVLGAGGGGTAGSGDSSDALKATYLTPVIAGFQAGISISHSTNGPDDTDGGVLGAGVGAKYSGSGSGLDYAVSLVWGDTALTTGIGDTGVNPDPAIDGYGGLGIGLSLGGAGVSFATGITIDQLGAESGPDGKIIPIGWSGGVAYAIGDVANVSVSSDIKFGVGEDETTLGIYHVFVSGDYAVLPGVTLALDLGYGGVSEDIQPDGTGFTGVFRAKAAF